MVVPAFVPDDFDVPLELVGHGFRLEPLGPEHNAADYGAWTSSIEHIRATPGFTRSKWPFPMSVDDNQRDVQRHSDDFDNRRGFTYTVLDAEGDVIGCVYIYPSDELHTGAAVSSWVSADRGHLDRPVWQAVSSWLRSSWPFPAVEYAERVGEPRGS